jgi:hypothetical protein
MRWALIILNVVAAIGLVVMERIATAAHRTHVNSTFGELEQEGVLLRRPQDGVARRMATIAGGGAHPLVAWCGAAACLANAAALAAMQTKPTSPA